MSWLRETWTWLSDQPHQRKGLRALQMFLGAMFVFRMSTEVRFAGFLWGPHGLGHGTNAVLFGPAGKVLDLAYVSTAASVFVAFMLAAAGACLILGKWTRAATLVALVSFNLLDTRLGELSDGGDNVSKLVLVYMLFCLSSEAKPRRGSLLVWLHNVAVLAIGAQLCVLYFTSGFMKVTGERWNHGVATYLISQVEWFSLPAARELFKNPAVAMISAYSTMIFQVWFPIAIFTRAKLFWLAVGIFFHVNIAVMMGLVAFSLAMTGLELFMITDDEWAMFAAKGARMMELARSLWRGRGRPAAVALGSGVEEAAAVPELDAT